MLFRIAGETFSYAPLSGGVEHLLHGYSVNLSSHATAIESDAVKKHMQRLWSQDVRGALLDETDCEKLALFECVCNVLEDFGALFVHSSVVMLDGSAYAFAGPSGMGKSTHASLWVHYLGATRLADDRPFFRRGNDGWTVYGSPWTGKEGWGVNGSAPLQGLCFIARGSSNKVRRLDNDEAVEKVLRQTIMQWDWPEMDRHLGLVEHLVSEIPLYELSCDISKEAALASRRAMVRPYAPSVSDIPHL